MVDICGGGGGGGTSDLTYISSLSNRELSDKLKNDFGFVCGPITESTRSVYEKKLANCIKEKGSTSAPRASVISSNKSKVSPVSGRPSIRLRPSLHKRWRVGEDFDRRPVYQLSDQQDQHSIYGSHSSKSLETISEWTSLSIIGVFLLFFTVIATFYLYSRMSFNISSEELGPKSFSNFDFNFNDLTLPVCNQEDNQFCVNNVDRVKPSLLVLRYILNYIEMGLLDFYCSKEPERADAHTYTLNEIFKSLQSKSNEIEAQLGKLMPSSNDPALKSNLLLADYFHEALAFIVRNPDLKLSLVKENEDEQLIKVDRAYPINLPLTCRLKVFLWETGKLSLFVATIAIFIGGIYKYISHKKRMETEEQTAVQDLVRKSIELLQSPDEPRSMPVINIRDTLLTPQQRKDVRWKKIWANVVDYIEQNEYNVKAAIEEINGEEFKTWKWLKVNKPSRDSFNNPYNESPYSFANRTSSGTVMKTGTIEWQGSAFGNDRTTENGVEDNLANIGEGSCNGARGAAKNKALTRFLKIRNIPSKELGAMTDWKAQIRNAILRKCSAFSPDGHHGILHLDIGGADTNESPIYMKCDSMDSATNAFNALHGWWCERNLVSVKFLKEDRYYERFPEATQAKTPLQLSSVDQQ